MTNCEKCYHNKVCINGANHKNAESCINFKGKSLIAELPCKVGSYVYEVSGNEMYRLRVKQIVFSRYDTEIKSASTDLEEFKDDFENGELEEYEDQIEFYTRDFGKTVFLTKSEAEAALKERESNGKV